MSPEDHRVSVIYRCKQGHEHPLCVLIRRQVPPDLRCAEGQGQGYGQGGGGGCRTPPGLQILVERVLRDSFQESKRRGFVLIHD